jgi:PHD/YefM family antitoxin component YafN of YafNO toxin-antitoxin module
MVPMDNIHPLTDFKRNTTAFRRRLKKSGAPAVLTVDGRAALVVLDPAAYQKMADAVDRAEAIEGIRKGLESMRQGKGRPMDEFFVGMRKKYHIPARKSRP